MSYSYTENAKKYASISETAAAQAKLYANKLEMAPNYAEQAAASAVDAASSALVAVNAEVVVNNLVASASGSATSAAESAAQAGNAASAAISQCLRVPIGESVPALPAEADRHNSLLQFDSSGQASILPKSDIAILDPDGKVPSSMIPAVALTVPFVVNSQPQMLALTAQVGDIAKRTDLGYSFVLSVEPASKLANWIQLNDDILAQLNLETGAAEIGAESKTGSASNVQLELNKKLEKTEFLSEMKKRGGDVIYASDFLPDSYSPGEDVSSQLIAAVDAVNAIPNTERNGDPVTLEFPSGWFKHENTMWFTRPVVLTSSGNTKLEMTGYGSQIKFGPDGITFNGDNGGLDHRLHVTYGFIGSGLFTFTGDLFSDGIVYNEYVTNPRIIGLRFINYGSENYYQVKLWGQCWDITVDNIRHSYTKSKAINWLSANGKMKDGTVDYGNSRLHIGSDVYLQIEGNRSGGVCIDAGGADYRFDGVAQGWGITHQLGAFAFNPRINGYHETIYPECQYLITYGGKPEDTIVPDDHYFKGGVIGSNGFYWNAHNIDSGSGYHVTNCRFMRPGRPDVLLINTRIENLDLFDYDNGYPLVTTNLSGPSFGNSYGRIAFPSIQVHETNAMVDVWSPSIVTTNLVTNGSGKLSREGDSFSFSSPSTDARVFDFWQYTSTGTALCNFYRNKISNDIQFTHEGTAMGIVVPTANNDEKSLRAVIDKDAFKAQGKELTLSFMAVNGTPNVNTKLNANLILVFSISEGINKVYSFGSFDIGASWGLKKHTLSVPFNGLVSTDDAIAYLSFDLPKGQPMNIAISNVNLTSGSVAVQGPSQAKCWDLLSQSIAYYGS